MPGSRNSEVERIGPYLAQTAAWLSHEVAGIQFIVPAANADLRGAIESQFGALAPSVKVNILDGQAHEAIAACDAALIVSGTAALVVMLSKRPMVIAYRMAPLSYYAARLLRFLGLMKLEYISLPNLLADRPLVPELIQGQATPEALGQEILKVLHASPQRDELIAAFEKIQVQLQQSAGDRAARAVLKLAGLLNS